MPQGGARAGLVFLHALAEEMNKSRRMVALQAAALRDAGFAVLVPDLYGCGDSAGDFADASWARWVQDGLLALRWMRARHGGLPLWLWGHRAGALLASATAAEHPGLAGLLLWQPCVDGAQALQPWRRLQRTAALLGRAAPARQAQEPLVAAGYRFAPALVSALQASVLAVPAGLSRAVWLDLDELAPAARQAVAPSAALTAWRQGVPGLEHAVLQGSAFWRSTGIDELPALLAATTQALQVAQGGPSARAGAVRAA
jgi:exosortase A-associated hydrolase 2